MSTDSDFDNSEKRKSHILNLVKLAQADGKWHENEKKFVASVAKRIGLTDEEHEDLIFYPDRIKFVPAISERERIIILYDLLFMMKMDGKVNQDEEMLCMELGLRLGFNPAMIDEMIQVMKDYTGNQVPQDGLLDVLKKYMN